jgi:ribosomal protein S6--L-glutamate ligase
MPALSPITVPPRASARTRRCVKRRVVVVAERRYREQPQPAGLIEALQASEHRVEVVDPELVAVGHRGWLEHAGVVVARGRSLGLLAALTAAEASDVPTVNRRAAIGAVHNKADQAAALVAGGLPTPRTWLGAVTDLVRALPRWAYPAIVKPVFGDNAKGLRLVESAEQLEGLEWPEPLALVQRWVAGDGCDTKVYGIGERLWAVRKPSPLSASTAPPELVELTPALAQIGRRCRGLFGLDLFGVDCVDGPDGVFVIEVNDFPNYSAVPGASEAVANLVLGRLAARSA